MSPLTQRRLRITGRVQGVGYRWAICEAARRLGLTGWVRNRVDGSVEALVCGPAAAIDALVVWAHQGPPAAQVDAIEQSSADGEAPPAGEFSSRPTV